MTEQRRTRRCDEHRFPCDRGRDRSHPINSRNLYVEALGLPLQDEGDGYYHSEQIAGCKSFEIWPLSQAAQACFRTDQWPAERPVPQVSIEFDVATAAAVVPAAQKLEQAGFELLHGAREEPWGQTVARLQSPEGDHRYLLRARAARLTPARESSYTNDSSREYSSAISQR